MPGGVTILEEPQLEFRFGQRLVDPHAGLGLFGPFDADLPSGPKGVAYGLVGTPEGIAGFELFSKVLTNPIVSCSYGEPGNEDKEHRLWPPFPGFEAAFVSTWQGQAAWARILNRDRLLEAATLNDRHRRVYDVVNQYLDALRLAANVDEHLDVMFCIVPDEVWLTCRPLSSVPTGHGERVSARDRALRVFQPDLFGTYDPVQYRLSPDFRRQIKARAMELRVPMQIIRESTLDLRGSAAGGKRGLTPLSDRAWNLSTAIYYKAGGKPWRLVTAREGVCYVGIAFRRADDRVNKATACCAAQMFLDTGDGVVFRGEFGPWYSPEHGEYHLSRTAARDLLSGVLENYGTLGGKGLREIFLHCRSNIDDEEFSGYREACPAGTKLVGVRVRPGGDGVRLYRRGRWPVIRGSTWILNRRTAYLWASGFKPSVLTYDGWEVPAPLRIDAQHGQADIEQVVKDIFGLTKLNYNACRLGESSPVTVKFSDAVGEILVSNPTVTTRLPNFKYYI